MALKFLVTIVSIIISLVNGAPLTDTNPVLCSQNKDNCQKSSYIRTVCPLTCSGKQTATTVCSTGAAAADTTCSISSNCPANFYCYNSGCCPLPTCNDGVTKSSQTCDNVQNFCPTGYECQNGGCCPRRATGSAGRGQAQQGQAVPAVVSPGGGAGKPSQPDPRKPKNDATTKGVVSTG